MKINQATINYIESVLRNHDYSTPWPQQFKNLCVFIMNNDVNGKYDLVKIFRKNYELARTLLSPSALDLSELVLKKWQPHECKYHASEVFNNVFDDRILDKMDINALNGVIKLIEAKVLDRQAKEEELKQFKLKQLSDHVTEDQLIKIAKEKGLTLVRILD